MTSAVDCRLCSAPSRGDIVDVKGNQMSLASYGALVDGWVLVAPRAHVLALADLDHERWDDFEDFAAETASMVRDVYGVRPVLFEHGPSRSGRQAGCGVDHAHLHVVPLRVDLRAAIATLEGPSRAAWLPSPHRPHRVGELDYLWIADESGTYIRHTEEASSQVVRRALARHLGEKTWDWKQDHRLDRVNRTMRALTQSSTVLVSNLLSLVHEGQRPVTDDEIESWGQDTRKQVSDWASAVHLNASDHTGVAVPAMPSVLRPTYEDRAGEFSRALADLHSEKHRVYGDSWKKRGEMIGILANIARKVDRLGVDGGGDTSLDTAMDLAIYLAKYLAWLDDQANGTNTSSGDGVPNDRILATRPSGARNIGVAEDALRRGFEILESVVSQGQDRRAVAEQLYTVAYNLAYRLWWHSQNKTRSWNPDA